MFLDYHKLQDKETIKYNMVSDEVLSKLKLTRDVIINEDIYNKFRQGAFYERSVKISQLINQQKI